MSTAVSILPSQWDNTSPSQTNFPGFINPHTLAQFEGDLKVWAVYQELVYLSRVYNLGKGWFYRTIDAIKNKLYLSAYAVRCAIRQLEELKFIKTEVRRINRTPYLHFRMLCKAAPAAPEQQVSPSESQSSHPSAIEACTLRLSKGNKKIEVRREKEEENTAVAFDDCGYAVEKNFPEEESGGEESSESSLMENLEESSVAPKKKSIASVTQLNLSKITAPKKVPKTTEELYRLFCREYGKRFDGAYPETMTVKVRKHIAAIKGIFGEDTPRFFELVIKNWWDASAYVANRTTGLTPVKTPSLGYIRTGTNLMHFKTWWDDLMAPVLPTLTSPPAGLSTGLHGASQAHIGGVLLPPQVDTSYDPSACVLVHPPEPATITPPDCVLVDPPQDVSTGPGECVLLPPQADDSFETPECVLVNPPALEW